MAIIKQRGLQLRVATINDRNNIVKRPEHLVVHVDDAIADPLAGVGPAIYKWTEASGGKWLLLAVGGVHEVLSTREYVDAGLDTKVDKVVGKQLSTEDYTTVEKTKLSTLENYTLPIATNTIVGGVKVGSGLSITNGLLSVNDGGVADSVEWTGVNNTPTTLSGYGITDAATSGHIHTDVSTTVSGFMSASDKVKLNSLSNYNKPSSEPISYITGLQTELDSKATTTALNTEKAKIDAILNAAGASTDTFAEIVTLINSVDTTNDTAFSGYVTSNNSRSTTIETNITNLTNNKVDKTNVQALHATDALRNVGSVISLYKGDGTFESITVPDTLYTHPNSGVIAGTYRSVTVNTQGHITGGTNPTTLAGYGITTIDCGSIV